MAPDVGWGPCSPQHVLSSSLHLGRDRGLEGRQSSRWLPVTLCPDLALVPMPAWVLRIISSLSLPTQLPLLGTQGHEGLNLTL